MAVLDDETKKRIEGGITAFEELLFRINGLGVVATLAFISAHGKGYGLLVFCVLVIFLLGTFIGVAGKFAGSMDELYRENLKFSRLMTAVEEIPEERLRELNLGYLAEYARDRDESHPFPLLAGTENKFAFIATGCAGIGTALGLFALFKFV